MRCTYCESNKSRAVNTRIINNKGVIKRRRECLNCNKRYTTYELPAKIKD